MPGCSHLKEILISLNEDCGKDSPKMIWVVPCGHLHPLISPSRFCANWVIEAEGLKGDPLNGNNCLCGP